MALTKSYVFVLLFFKRISEVCDEVYQTSLAEAGSDEQHAPLNYSFKIPENCH